jgi:3-hydroxyacyl-CoA dehydrogenase / enoyl-CoA hydratase / 3-hydroxybutyryl-CoA epimerase
MLIEGVPPAMIENAGRMAGMPVGPLSLNDEVALDLSLKIMKAARADLGDDIVPEDEYRLIEEMVEPRPPRPQERQGLLRLPGERRDKKTALAGLAELCPPVADPDAIDVAELKRRFLAIQSLESARCFAEGVVTDVREADVGSILGFGFAPFTGGTLSYIDFISCGFANGWRRNTAAGSGRTGF